MGICGKLLQIIVPGVVIIFAMVAAATAAASTMAKPGCPNKCGDVEIPFPFGLTEDCYLDVSFNISCRLWKTIDRYIIDVKSISIETHEMRILNSVARRLLQSIGWSCTQLLGPRSRQYRYTISNTKNKITVLGCDTYAYLSGYQNGEWYSDRMLISMP
jgi:hypothetical protein